MGPPGSLATNIGDVDEAASRQNRRVAAGTVLISSDAAGRFLDCRGHERQGCHCRVDGARISRAQSMDVLSSMANIGGYQRGYRGGEYFWLTLTGRVTAAKMPPAKGVCKSVRAWRVWLLLGRRIRWAHSKALMRAETADQVESMGGECGDSLPPGESSDGYARNRREQAKAALRGCMPRSVPNPTSLLQRPRFRGVRARC